MESTKRTKPSCGICGSVNRPLLCSQCANDEFESVKETNSWRQLVATRNKLQNQLQEKLKLRLKQNQELEVWKYLERGRKELEVRELELESKLNSTRKKLEEMEAFNWSRIDYLSSLMTTASQSLESLKDSINGMEANEESFLEMCEMAFNQMMRDEVLTLMNTIELKKHNDEVEIMNVRLPPLTSLQLTSPADDIGAAAGYALWVIEKLGFYCSVPLLHLSRFECSTSQVMKPDRLFHKEGNTRWIKHRLFVLPSTNSSPESLCAAWNDMFAGIQLLHKSLKSIGASMDLSTQQISFFHLLHIIMEKLSSDRDQEENHVVNWMDVVHGSRDDQDIPLVDEEWCCISGPVLPPPPWADNEIAQYESALKVHEVRSSQWQDLYRLPMNYVSSMFDRFRLENCERRSHKGTVE